MKKRKVRPERWNVRTPAICPEKYELELIHDYFIEKLRRKNNELQHVHLKKGFYKKTGLFGLVMFDEKIIFLAEAIDNKEKLITLFHELAHLYFHDEGDNDNDSDRVEKRAEASAQNMFTWYYNNRDKLKILMRYVKRIPISKFDEYDEEMI